MLREQQSETAQSTARTEVCATHEARMPKEDHILTLKNGSKDSAHAVLAVVGDLRYVLRNHRRHFELLLSLAQADANTQPQSDDIAFKESMKYLKMSGYFDKDGTIAPRVRNVLESSYQVTPDGPVLVQPFALATDAEKAIADRAEKELVDWFADRLRDSPDDDTGRRR